MEVRGSGRRLEGAVDTLSKLSSGWWGLSWGG